MKIKATKSVSVMFSSGLGNQMFMYALYLYIQQSFNNVDLRPNLFIYKFLNPHQGFELHKIVADSKIAEAFKKLAQVADRGKEPFLHKYLRILHDKLLGVKYITDAKVHNISDVHNAISSYKRCQFVGFFQIPDFISAIMPELNNHLRQIELAGKNKELLIRNLPYNTVSIHVRRGDYVGNPYFDVLDYKTYYSQAIAYIKNHVDNPKFILFSDDTKWALANLVLDSGTEICDWNTGEDSWLDMIMMSECHHNVIANSSFSYWGGY